MGINWVTFIAQLINLFVLVWLLKRFLYRPILEAVDKRQAEITNKVKQAQNEYESAKQEHQELLAQKHSFQLEKETLFNQAAEQIDSLRKIQKEELSAQKQKALQKIKADILADKKQIETQVRDLAIENFMTLSQKLVKDFGLLTPFENTVLLFQKTITELPEDEKSIITKALQKKNKLTILVSQKLTDLQEKEIQKTLADTFLKGQSVLCFFKEEPSLILGLELKTDELLVEWSLKSYLDEMQENMNKSLLEKLES